MVKTSGRHEEKGAGVTVAQALAGEAPRCDSQYQVAHPLQHNVTKLLESCQRPLYSLASP